MFGRKSKSNDFDEGSFIGPLIGVLLVAGVVVLAVFAALAGGMYALVHALRHP